MDIRSVVDNLRKKGQLEEISTPVSRHLAAAGRIAAASPRPVYFHDLDGYRVAANLVTGRQAIADALGLPMEGFLAALNERLRDGGVIEQVKEPPCQELVIDPPDLTRLPILLHYPGDGGPYLTSGVWVVEDPVNGRNLSYHRMMLLDDRTGVARVVEGRGMARALSRGGPGTPVAVCIGVPYNVLIAAALSPAEDLDECILAARLGPLQLAPCRTIELEVPAATEIVLEMRYTGKTAPEGPFLDITKTTDIEREQPVFEVSAITMRRDPIYHALLPAGIEHCSLMGLPKELDIYAAVSRTCEARDVVITPGGCSWLHAVIAIAVRDRKDAERAMQAAFAAHRSLKHCVVVDTDIDPGSASDVEWAIATRFQAPRDLLVIADQPSSSLDPSASHTQGQKSRGGKMGLDATIPTLDPDTRRLFHRIDHDFV